MKNQLRVLPISIICRAQKSTTEKSKVKAAEFKRFTEKHPTATIKIQNHIILCAHIRIAESEGYNQLILIPREKKKKEKKKSGYLKGG